MIWFWIGLVRCVWKWERDRLGISIFKIIQYGFIVITVATMVFSGEIQKDFKFIFAMLVVIDIAIAWLMVNFLILVWFARCKLWWRDYWDIGSVFGMIVLQVWMMESGVF